MKTQHYLTRHFFGGVVTGIGLGIMLSILIMSRMLASPENLKLISDRGLMATWGMIAVWVCYFVGEFIARGGYKRRSNKKAGA
jgi:hypothetical protein